jgi:hypothetical protein
MPCCLIFFSSFFIRDLQEKQQTPFEGKMILLMAGHFYSDLDPSSFRSATIPAIRKSALEGRRFPSCCSNLALAISGLLWSRCYGNRFHSHPSVGVFKPPKHQ